MPAWMSSAWHIATNDRVAASTVLGAVVREGETGLVRPPATWHFPGHGSFVIEGTRDVLIRSDQESRSSVRHVPPSEAGRKPGEQDGDHDQHGGHRAVTRSATRACRPSIPSHRFPCRRTAAAFSGSPNIVHSCAARFTASSVGETRTISSIARAASASRPFALYNMASPPRART